MVVMYFLYFDVFDGHVQSTNTPLSFQCSDPQNRACQMRPRNTCTILEVPLILSPSKVSPSKFSGWLIVFFSYGSMGGFGIVTWSIRINTQKNKQMCGLLFSVAQNHVRLWSLFVGGRCWSKSSKTYMAKLMTDWTSWAWHSGVIQKILKQIQQFFTKVSINKTKNHYIFCFLFVCRFFKTTHYF